MKQDRNWHHLTVDELSSIFKTDSVTGLSQREAARRLRRGTNKIWTVRSISLRRYAGRSLADFSTVLLVITALLAAVFGNAAETAAVCVMLAAARCARIIVYVLAQRVFEKNAAASLPRARVVRAGTVKTIPADGVVPGDMVVLDTGDTVPCDVRLTAADNVLVSEGQLTENEGIVAKSAVDIPKEEDVPIPLRTNMLYASSAVIGGFCMGMAVATGEHTLVYAREGQIELSNGEELPSLGRLSDLGRQCSLGLILIALAICLVGTAVGGQDLFAVFLPSIAMAAACLNEYIGAAGAMAWAAALRHRKKGDIVFRDAAAGERAAEIQLLLLRSTAALKSKKTSFHAYYTQETYHTVSKKVDPLPGRLLYLAYCTTGITPGMPSAGSAVEQSGSDGVLPYPVVRSLWEEQKAADLSATERFAVVQHMSAGQAEARGMDCSLLARDGVYYFVCLGRTEEVLAQCTTQRGGEETIPLLQEDRDKILSLASSLTMQGVSVAAVGFRPSHYNSLRRVSVLQSNLCFEGFIAVSQKPAADTLAALRSFREEGGRVILFSRGSEEDRCFAQAEGILGQRDIYMTCQESAAARTLSLEPGQLAMIGVPGGIDGIRERVRFLRMCREGGLCCGYFGWGVEDLWAMQQADVAFAAPVPGKFGADIPQTLRVTAQGMADMGEGGLGSVLRTIMRCRGAMRNLSNVLSYLIVSHMTRIVLLLLCAAIGLPLLSAAQIVFWGILMDFSVSAAGVLIPAGNYVPFPVQEEEKSTDAVRQKGFVLEGTKTLLLALYGTLLAVLAAAAPYLGRALIDLLGPSCSLHAGIQQSCMFLTCTCIMPFIAAEFCTGGLFRKHAAYGHFFWMPFAAAFVGIFWTVITGGLADGSGAGLDTQAPGWLLLLFALLPMLLSVAVLSGVRAVLYRKNAAKCK